MYRLLFRVKSKDMKRMLDTIGGRVRFFRELKGLTQEELAKAAGLHKDFISNLERWTLRYRNPPSENLIAIAEILGVPAGLLLDKSLRNFFRDTGIDAQTYIQMSEGERTQAIRKWRALSPATLAKQCNVSVDELRQLETMPKLPFAKRHRVAFEMEIEPYWISLEGVRLDHGIPPAGNKIGEEFASLFKQLPKISQEIVLKSAITLMQGLLSQQPLTEPKGKKRKKQLDE